jgi:ribosomal-protein-alanine N-acetyltransferase
VPASRFTLRNYRPEDFETLWALDQVCFTQGIAYSKEELSYFLNDKSGFTIVAEQDGAIQGFIVIQKAKKQVGHVITIDVQADARRSGLGTLLIQAAEQRMKSEDCSAVLLEVAVDNMPAIRFYKRHGYSVLKTIPRYYLNSIDALMMGKNLSG